MVYDSGVATTYSLDPLTLLCVPVHLAWLVGQDDQTVLTDPIRLLEALQRVTDRLTVFTDRGRIQVPSQANPLYALLERTIAEVRAPRGGAFHPKIWVLRFVSGDRGGDVVLRLGVLSRNLTSDRSWDLSLVLEGQPRGAYIAANRPLGELVAKLPSWSVDKLSESRTQQVEQLADEIRRTPWSLPGSWDELRFHVLGARRGTWDPGEADDLVVISPFLTAEALAQLRSGTKRQLALVSRPDALAALPAAARSGFERCLVLDDAAETEDGEEPGGRDNIGLHAKAVLLRRGWRTHLFVGSANATTAAMVAGTNVEVMVELVGLHSKVGRPEQLLDKDGFGGVLTDFDPTTPPEDPGLAATEAALEDCQRALSKSSLVVDCLAAGEGAWALRLTPATVVHLGAVSVKAWPLSLHHDRSVDGAALASGAPVDLGVVDAADITGLIGFELSIDRGVRRFALNLTVNGLPDERDAAILRRIIRNREGFLRYLKLLLDGLGPTFAMVDDQGAGTAGAWQVGANGVDALLEDLVRVWSREPTRLRDVQRVVSRLRGQEGEDGSVIPPEFDALWSVFEEALGETR